MDIQMTGILGWIQHFQRVELFQCHEDSGRGTAWEYLGVSGFKAHNESFPVIKTYKCLKYFQN